MDVKIFEDHEDLAPEYDQSQLLSISDIPPDNMSPATGLQLEFRKRTGTPGHLLAIVTLDGGVNKLVRIIP